MISIWRRRRRSGRWLAVGLATVAVLAAGASANAAATRPTLEQLEQFRFTPVTSPATASLPSIAQLEQFSFTPVGALTPPVGSPTEYDTRAAERSPVAAPAQSNPQGFDWGDAAVGAGLAIGLLLLAGLVSLVARRYRRLVHS
jgi:hypothetical protein